MLVLDNKLNLTHVDLNLSIDIMTDEYCFVL